MVQLTRRVRRSVSWPSRVRTSPGTGRRRGAPASNDFLGALALEVGGGEPFGFMHPVRWMRRAIWLLGRFAPRNGKKRQLAYGAVGAVAVPAAFTALAERGRQRAEAGGTAPGTAFRLALLKSTFAVRAPMGETGSERSTDAFLAPWLAYAVGGLPAAFAYRALSTLDDELGYRKGQNGMTGAPAAGLTDVAGFVPGRIGAGLTALAAVLWREDAGAAVRALGRRHDGRRHGIKRAGGIRWTVAAMAAGLTYGALLLRERLSRVRSTPRQ